MDEEKSPLPIDSESNPVTLSVFDVCTPFFYFFVFWFFFFGMYTRFFVRILFVMFGFFFLIFFLRILFVCDVLVFFDYVRQNNIEH